MSDNLKAPRYRLVGYDIGTAPDENGGWVHWTDHEAEIARLTAERDAALVGAVKVKPLVWEQYTTWPDAYDADSTVGRYSIGRYDKGVFSCHVEPQMRDIGLRFLTVQDAMAAAQADYEARILAAIQPDQDARQADLAKAAITALHDIDDLVANSEGVSGLHLNGDIAPWSEIMDGGAYGAWLQSVERLCEAIRALLPPADLAAKIGGE